MNKSIAIAVALVFLVGCKKVGSSDAGKAPTESHTKTFTNEKSPLTGQSNVTLQPFSDFAVHDMGTGLADGVSQGTANGNEFRTAPLWGVGQRIFFLHDGRTKDLHEAIQQHASRGSEANAVINNYNLLSRDDKQALINYLRSL